MIGRTNAGGGGSGAYGMLLVTYPEGSIVTCKGPNNENVTLGKKNISDTQILFYIKKPTSGTTQTCVITATDGTQTTSKTVSIEYEGQGVNLSLSYELVLFDGDNGGDNRDVTGGWSLVITGPTFTITETEIKIRSNTSTRRCAFAVNPIPVQDYSKITFTGYTKELTYIEKQQFFIATKKINDLGVVVATVQAPESVPDTVEIDLSALSLTEGVDYYVGFANASLYNETYLLKCILS